MKKYDVLLFDVDGTLLDFDRAEEMGIEGLLEHYGVPVTAENKEKYHHLNKSYWERLERGEITRDQVLSLRFEEFFGDFGISVDGMDTDPAVPGILKTRAHFSLTAPGSSWRA